MPRGHWLELIRLLDFTKILVEMLKLLGILLKMVTCLRKSSVLTSSKTLKMLSILKVMSHDAVVKRHL